MCGILGYIGHREATDVLLDGLRKLEYRGYDSAGIAVQHDGKIQIRRAVGKLAQLDARIRESYPSGKVGVGHTRWATHGAPSEANAHPHMDAHQQIVVVHNGIIENHLSLRERLETEGYKFASETDTEVVANLVGSQFEALQRERPGDPKSSLIEAVHRSLKAIEGTFALGIMCLNVPDFIIGARRDCPLIVGKGDGELFLASDVPAILSYTRDVIFLEDGDVAILDGPALTLKNESGSTVDRAVTRITWDPIQAEKAGYKHFMLKEIHEQSRTVEDTLLGRLNMESGAVTIPGAQLDDAEVKRFKKVRLIACGTSWHAGLVGSYWIERYAGIPCQVEIASEFRYRDPIVEPDTFVVTISQSGETADTLAAARLAKKKGAKVVTIANVMGSSLTREAHGSILTHCGPEIGVASTKAFLGQLVALYLIALNFGRIRGTTPEDELVARGRDLTRLPRWITDTLKCEETVKAVAKIYYQRRDFLFLGRNLNYPIALEGALKLKEVSYIHAEGYPAGEMKHGPIALIDQVMPVVAIVSRSKVYDKMISSMEEARSRGAEVIAIATEGDRRAAEKAAHAIYVPEVPEDLTPMVNVIPLQMLAYRIAVLRGCDVDQPRNLAKSVTVE